MKKTLSCLCPPLTKTGSNCCWNTALVLQVVRAMEIIAELEPSKRSIYAGAVGYLGFNGDMDLAIAIRTAVIKNGVLYVQAGGGLAADSMPASEWTETQNKTRAVLRAAEMVLAGLDNDLE